MSSWCEPRDGKARPASTTTTATSRTARILKSIVHDGTLTLSPPGIELDVAGRLPAP
jgi:hypothetical protein